MVAISDSDGVVEQCSYDVFGAPSCVSEIGNPYKFTGRRYDDETGLYYYRARYYSPELGRFLQPDPKHYIDGLNLYTYCGNNPINWLDPYGLIKITPWPVPVDDGWGGGGDSGGGSKKGCEEDEPPKKTPYRRVRNPLSGRSRRGRNPMGSLRAASSGFLWGAEYVGQNSPWGWWGYYTGYNDCPLIPPEFPSYDWIIDGPEKDKD